MDENFKLEKLRVVERLEAVEDHMKKGEENRQVLISGFNSLTATVKRMEVTLFGEQGELGIVQRMDAFLKIADAIKWVLQKIFVAICSAIALSMMPGLLKYISEVLKNQGGFHV